MSLESKYNLKSPGVKRLMREASELANPTEDYFACPLDDNLFEWHFTIKGPAQTEFDGGYYHGRILLPSEYPMKPPNIILLTPNGRFEVNKKICLSISGFHPESWQPSWSIRTALLALIAFMPVSAKGAIGSLEYSADERKVLAKKSQNWECSTCGKVSEKLLATEGLKTNAKLTEEEHNLIRQITLKHEGEEGIKENVKEIVPQILVEENVVTQRNVLQNDNSSTESSVLTTESSSESSISRESRLWTILIWILVTAIALLFFRRILIIFFELLDNHL